MVRALTACALILTLALSFSRRGETRDVRQGADRSKAAVDAPTPEQALAGIDAAWQGELETAPAVYTGEGHKTLPAYTVPLSPSTPSTSLRAGRPEGEGYGEKTIAERRRELRGKRGPGKFLRACAYGLAAFVAGAALGWAAGAVGARAFVMKAPNPRIHKWRYALIVPAMVAGAVVGEICLPFLLGAVFFKAQPYPTKGVPDRTGLK